MCQNCERNGTVVSALVWEGQVDRGPWVQILTVTNIFFYTTLAVFIKRPQALYKDGKKNTTPLQLLSTLHFITLHHYIVHNNVIQLTHTVHWLTLGDCTSIELSVL